MPSGQKINKDHSWFKNRVSKGIIKNQEQSYKSDGHGTMVASVIARRTVNSIKSVNIIPVEYDDDINIKNDLSWLFQWTCQQAQLNFKNNISIINASNMNSKYTKDYYKYTISCTNEYIF